MKSMKEMHAITRTEWRKWLVQNHDKNPGIWLIFYKKHTGKSTLEYDAAVEEALCFGWIDSIIRKIDEERYARKFTPRKCDSHWSKLNNKSRQSDRRSLDQPSGKSHLGRPNDSAWPR